MRGGEKIAPPGGFFPGLGLFFPPPSGTMGTTKDVPYKEEDP